MRFYKIIYFLLFKRLDGVCEGKVDVRYYTPGLKMYDSFINLLYCERDVDWRNFNFNSGRVEPNYSSPTYRKFGGNPQWQDDELDARREKFNTQAANRLIFFNLTLVTLADYFLLKEF